MKRISLFSLFIILLICVQSLDAKISVTANGKTSGTSLVQGDTLSFIISGIPVGAMVTSQLWIDLDSNGFVNPSTDVLFASFSQTDGVTTGFGDMDSSANGRIYVKMGKVSMVPDHYYLLRSICGTDTASATFTITARSTTCTMSGKVTKLGIGVANILITAHGWGDRDGLTDASGNYTIITDATVGNQYIVQLYPISIPIGYTVSPTADTVILNTTATSGINFVLTSVTGVDQPTSVSPKEFALNQNYPNPFNPSTVISYHVASVGKVNLKVFDLLGREVATLVNEVKSAGSYTATFNAANLPSGVYFYRLQAGSFTETKRLVLLK